LASRATMRRVEGGAGSKRILLGCDPGARHSAHRIHATHAHLHGRIPASGARRRAEEGPLWGSDPEDAHRIGNDALMIRSTVASPQAGALLRVAPIPAPRSGAPPILAATLKGWREFWPVAPGSRREAVAFGAETGADGRRSLSYPGAWASFPQAGLRLTSHDAHCRKPLA
jgi:hypothetical protein